MEDIARQLDSVRDEMVQLLRDYPYASDRDREDIYTRCEFLGGEIQELVGVLKLAIRNTNAEAAEEADHDPEYYSEVARLSTESLVAIHSAGEEVAAAITMLRESRGETEDESYC
ncbi:MAG: hypothetical protein H6817_10795 [Phycisphaerales bacterium]|nr:hypothetical protein [Phycisphaerales bacterium]